MFVRPARSSKMLDAEKKQLKENAEDAIRLNDTLPKMKQMVHELLCKRCRRRRCRLDVIRPGGGLQSVERR